MKKAQVAGQIFIYILAIFIFAVIMLFGYTAIKGFIDKGEQASFIQFKNTIESETASLYTEPGDITVFNGRNLLPVPSKYKTICFIGHNVNSHSSIPDYLSEELKQIIESAISVNIHKNSENVFFDPLAENSIFLDGIITDSKILCKNITQSKLDIRMEGLGYGVRIS